MSHHAGFDASSLKGSTPLKDTNQPLLRRRRGRQVPRSSAGFSHIFHKRPDSHPMQLAHLISSPFPRPPTQALERPRTRRSLQACPLNATSQRPRRLLPPFFFSFFP